MGFHNRWIRYALKIARRSNHPRHLMSCVIVKGGAVISAAPNSSIWGNHAEIRAIRPSLDLKDATAYIMRLNLRNSKPCKECQQALREAGIHTVVYVDAEGLLRKERVSQLAF